MSGSMYVVHGKDLIEMTEQPYGLDEVTPLSWTS